jgi:hypothetical protein
MDCAPRTERPSQLSLNVPANTIKTILLLRLARSEEKLDAGDGSGHDAAG